MSRPAITTTLVIYAAVALVLGEVMEAMRPYSHAHPIVAVIARAGGSMLAYFVLPGILPLILWGFCRFRAKDAHGPIVAWGILIAVFFGLSAAGTFYQP